MTTGRPRKSDSSTGRPSWSGSSKSGGLVAQFDHGWIVTARHAPRIVARSRAARAPRGDDAAAAQVGEADGIAVLGGARTAPATPPTRFEPRVPAERDTQP